MTTTSQTRLFGTDGMRGPFGDYPLDRPTVTALGYHLAHQLVSDGHPDPLVVVGGDTRFSTETLVSWLAAGLAAGGARTHPLGVLPTPAIALLARRHDAVCGIAVSASHNPFQDNGIKLLDDQGHKWTKAAEAELESRLTEPTPEIHEVTLPPLDPADVALYLAHLAGSLAPDDLAGSTIVLDAAHGATSAFAQRAFTDHGATVELLHATPNGRNINLDCGSTHPERLAQRVLELGADLGIAFDGDGDRALLVDEQGQLRDGDAMLFLWGRDLARRQLLEPRAIVATSMSNLGLERALAAEGISVKRCDVGDRAVVETMLLDDIHLGGEQSGHLVYSPLATTGDGMLTGLQLAAILRRGAKPASEQLADFVRFPQRLHNLPVAEKRPFEELPAVQDAAERARQELGDRGRLVLRYSGTEPLVRIMLEGPDAAELDRLTASIAAAFSASDPRP